MNIPAGELESRNLNALAKAELAALADLEVTPEQEVLGGSFTESLESWRTGPPDAVIGFCFSLGSVPIGTVLFKRPPSSPRWAGPDDASIHGLKIALPWQGRGWGHVAIRLAIGELRTAWPSARRLVLAVDAVNAPALAVYRGVGFSEIGEGFEGLNGREHRMKIDLHP